MTPRILEIIQEFQLKEGSFAYRLYCCVHFYGSEAQNHCCFGRESLLIILMILKGQHLALFSRLHTLLLFILPHILNFDYVKIQHLAVIYSLQLLHSIRRFYYWV